MQTTAARGSNRIERHLDGLRANSCARTGGSLHFRCREQALYLVVGGWNTVFGYGHKRYSVRGGRRRDPGDASSDDPAAVSKEYPVPDCRKEPQCLS